MPGNHDRDDDEVELRDLEGDTFLPRDHSTDSSSKKGHSRGLLRRWIPPRIRPFLEHASKSKLVITFLIIFLVLLGVTSYWNRKFVIVRIPWESTHMFNELVESFEGTIIPQYVLSYAPLVYLDIDEQFFPSDLTTHVLNTHPTTNDTVLKNIPDPLVLDNLDSLNTFGGEDKDIFLTSTYNLLRYPDYIYGQSPDHNTLQTYHAKSAVIIVVNKGDDVVDAFYMYFYTFNEGPNAFGHRVGNHLGDWEHNMIRFRSGVPESIWYSEHEYGKAFTYAAVHKSGKRPLCFSARGSHANYAKSGAHDLSESDGSVPAHIVFDHTSQGPLWDPILSAYFYVYTPSPSSPSHSDSPTPTKFGTFEAVDEETPVNYLYFKGRWGDMEYADEVEGQEEFHGFHKWTGGPRGPVFKGLERESVCLPRVEEGCVVRTHV